MLSREKALNALLELTGGPEPSTRVELLQRVLDACVPLVQADGAMLVVPHQGRLERLAVAGGVRLATPMPWPRRDSELTRLLLHVTRPLPVADLARDFQTDTDDACPTVDAGPALFVPMRRRGHAAGYLAAFRDRRAAPFSPADVRQLATLGAWAAMALENMRLSESIEKLAVTDDLTQVYNYRFLKLALKRELKRAARFGQELALIMLDVDHLKGYNDRNGHLRGSYLLRELATLLARQVRSFDLIAKYGGDEFTLILPQTGIEGALAVAERMRRAVAEHAFPLEGPGGITISLGVAEFPRDAEDGQTLVRSADQALYAAKRQGRNRVVTYRDVAEQAGTLR
jgi:diguanylate cyclase (GGDEF)-like protein